MSLSVVAGRSHSGFRAAVYGIHFDPWGFDTLLYFVKMVAVFCFNGCREFAFFVYAKELPAEDCPTLTFFLLRGSILRLRRAPSPRDYSLRAISLSLSHRCVDPSSAFGAALLQGPIRFGLSLFRFRTASRIHPPPSARPFSKGLLASDYLTFAFTPLRGSILRLCRAPSLRGYSLRTISLSLSHRFEDPSSAFGAPLL